MFSVINVVKVNNGIIQVYYYIQMYSVSCMIIKPIIKGKFLS